MLGSIVDDSLNMILLDFYFLFDFLINISFYDPTKTLLHGKQILGLMPKQYYIRN